MADLTVNTVTLAGIVDPTPVAAAAGGDTFTNDGKTLFKVVSGAAGAVTVTITGRRTQPLGQSATQTMAVANNETKLMGPFPPAWFNDNSNKVTVTYDQVTDVTVAPISVLDEFN